MESLNQSTLQIIGIQQILLDEILRSILYGRKLDGKEDASSIFIRAAMTKQAIITWCQIFGARSEQVHFSKVSDKQEIIERFDRTYIERNLGLSMEEWSKYHESMKHLRDKFFAHFDMDSFSAYIPNFDVALELSKLYRNWITRLLNEAINRGQNLRINYDLTNVLLDKVQSEFNP